MAFGDQIRKRAEQLRKQSEELKKDLAELARNATIRAIESATEKTPANQLRGANTVSGGLKAKWASDSTTQPSISNNVYITELANTAEYASYVNNGHRMDKHFVPGLTIDESTGMLQYDPGKNFGIIVGTKTAYVPGVYMKEAGVEKYKEVTEKELRVLGKKALR